MLLRFLCFILFISFIIPVAQSQSNEKFVNQKYKGGFVQYGIAYYDLPESDRYQPLILGGIYHLPFYQTSGRFNIGVDFMPQLGFASFNSTTSFEVGVNVQFNFNLEVGEKHIISARGGAGPHFVNVTTERQSKGFIFSDNFTFSYRVKLQEHFQLGIMAGIRHISNAGLQQPNLGIDNLIFGLEFAKLIE